MPDQQLQAFKGYKDPLEIVDRTEMPYEERLALLQAWQADLAKTDAPEEHANALTGAIQALETGAVVQDDAPEQEPDGVGYGAKES
jgi:hypothetical protein